MTIMEWAKLLLLGPTLQDKLTPLALTAELGPWLPWQLPDLPGREQTLRFSDLQIKFPSTHALAQATGRCQAIHSFANHELLAIEMMAAAILLYPHSDAASERMKRGIATAIRDEQKHLQLYLQRLADDGCKLGDFPLNNFFWRQMEKLKNPAQFFALMALTFESANLDFSLWYEEIFRAHGDHKSANILRVVYEDEITHVALGAHWLGQWRGSQSLWDYYQTLLPGPLTPARSKGGRFVAEARRQAGLDEDWIARLADFKDDFRITNRRLKG